MTRPYLHLGVALDGAGAHPAAWRSRGPRTRLVLGRTARAAGSRAERGGLDFVALDDGFDPPDRGRRCCPLASTRLLALARVAPATTSIGLVPTVTTTHTEPFHVSKNIATLDLVSAGTCRVAGRGVDAPEAGAAHFGRKRCRAARRAVRRGRGRGRGRRAACGTAGRTTP